MSLPNEIDQDVKCPSCDRELVIYDGGDGYCPSAACSERKFSPKHIAAFRNQIPPNHTAIPNAELEALRCALFDPRPHERARLNHLHRAAIKILAHLPAKKPNHVAELRRILNGYRSVHGTDRQRAALEAAIEKMEQP